MVAGLHRLFRKRPAKPADGSVAATPEAPAEAAERLAARARFEALMRLPPAKRVREKRP